MNRTLRVVVADDQRIVREGLAQLIAGMDGMEVVGLAADGEAAVSVCAAEAPDVVLMDLRMPVLDGAGATRRILQDHPEVRVVVLTTYADDRSILAALDAGACGYLTKDASRDDIRRAIDAAAAGQSVLDPVASATLLAAARRAPGAPQPKARPDGLTVREVEVLALVAQGLTNPEIARRLYISEATVKTHVNHVFAKTGSRDRVQASLYAHRHGLRLG